jgi:hypothetical protein
LAVAHGDTNCPAKKNNGSMGYGHAQNRMWWSTGSFLPKLILVIWMGWIGLAWSEDVWGSSTAIHSPKSHFIGPFLVQRGSKPFTTLKQVKHSIGQLPIYRWYSH